MSTNEPSNPESQREQEIQQIREALRGLRFGTVNIVVQDGLVVQIDRTEKRRLRAPLINPNASDPALSSSPSRGTRSC